jgi:hypothetical protein
MGFASGTGPVGRTRWLYPSYGPWIASQELANDAANSAEMLESVIARSSCDEAIRSFLLSQNPGIIIMAFQIARPVIDGPGYDHAKADRSGLAESPR